VAYATSDGTATQSGDYTSATGTLTFAPSETSKSFDVVTADDAFDENDETLAAGITNPANATVDVGGATGTIADNDDAPMVVVTDEQVTEGGAATFRLALTKASDTAVSVDYRTVDGTASAPADYVAASGTVSFAPGVTVQDVPVGTVEDRAAERDERFRLVLDEPVGMVLRNTQGTATITDDDVLLKPTISFSVAPTRDRKAPFRYVLTGRVKPPKGTSASACRANARVAARVTRSPRSKLVGTKRTTLSDKCRFRVKLFFAKRTGNGRMRVAVTYAGNGVLKAAKSKSRSLRAG
jgi:chitinase